MTTNPNVPEQATCNPQEDVARFLVDHGTAPDRRLEVAIQFAQSMSEELQNTLAQWQALERGLRDLRADAGV